MLTNKIISTISITVLVFCLFSCRSAETTTNTNIAENTNNENESTEFTLSDEADDFQNEAYEKAREFWEKKYPKCGDSNYSHHFQKFDSYDKETFMEIKGMSLAIEDWNNGEKTEADKLNEASDPKAIIWKGVSKLKVTSTRNWDSTQAKVSGNGWGKWTNQSHLTYFDIIKMSYLKNNEWQIEANNIVIDNSRKPVNCEEIPD